MKWQREEGAKSLYYTVHRLVCILAMPETKTDDVKRRKKKKVVRKNVPPKIGGPVLLLE